jgi:hypothetical protein
MATANYVLLERIELNAEAASVTFSNIPQTGYTDLKVAFSARQSTAAIAGDVTIQFNGSSASNSNKYVYGDGVNNGTGTDGYTPSLNYASIGVGNSATANTHSNVEIYIPNYTTSDYKSFNAHSVGESNSSSSVFQLMVAGLWSSASAINQITLAPVSSQSFLQYSTFSLYGLADVNTTPVISPKASGGNIQTDGTYWYHTFLSTGAFVPALALTCDYLVVAGGGAGASVGGSAETGGGGGGGGFRALTSQSLTAVSYTVTVGAGGSGGSSGTNSTINSISATGGGYGGGGSGGSGGGGLSANTSQRLGGAGNAGSYTPVEGYAGGNGNSSSNSYAGGGGGAGAAGANGTSGQSGAGGIGSYSAISGGSTTALGVLSGGNYYFAGGGGGGSASGVSAGSGGTGGGGAGETAGTINTGGGGGGGSPSSGSSRSGGSGIVIIRYTV